jgi:membrane protease YdiL (CAAX protease family)
MTVPGRWPTHDQARRWAEGILFVVIWMELGWAFRLDGNAYLLLGIPLTLVFQRFVRRAPIRALWVREAPPFPKGWLIIALIVAIVPVSGLIEAVRNRQWVVGGWMASAVVGSVAAGYALRHFRRETVWTFFLCQLTAGSIGIAEMVLARIVGGNHLAPDPLGGVRSFLLYFPVCFVLEEVSFRGALDSHLHHPGDRFAKTSTLIGTVLWGLWHLPILPPETWTFGTALSLAIVHTLIGVPLVLAWRRGGNLAVTAFAHALIDAVRNALRLMG